MRGKKIAALLLALLLLLTAGCGAKNAPETPEAKEPAKEAPAQMEPSGEEPVKEETEEPEPPAKQYLIPSSDDALPSLCGAFEGQFLVGAAVNTNRLTEGTDFYRTLTKHYNVFVTENEMKPMYMNPMEGVHNFTASDAFVAFCEKNGAAIRGHNLIWHDQAPEWWFQGSGKDGAATREELLGRMEEHITAVVSRYKGRIGTWDVVNEVVSDKGTGIRREDERSRYAAIVGDLDGDGHDWDYIEEAFRYARAADPDAQLIINDYDLELCGPKLDDFYEMVRAMLEKGVPIDGAGIQMHIRLTDPSLEEIEATMEKLASLREIKPDFVLQVTELDMSLFANGDESRKKDMTPELQREQAEHYADLFDIFREQAAKGNLDQVVFWGVTDGASWLDNFPVHGRTNAPLLFDRAMNAKPCFWGVVDRTKIEDAVAEIG